MSTKKLHRSALLMISLLFLLGIWQNTTAESLKVWQQPLGTVRHYQNIDGDTEITVTVVPLSPHLGKQALVRFSGVDHPLNDQTWVYQVSTQSAPFKTDYHLASTNRLYFQGRGRQTLYKGSLQEYFEVLLHTRSIKVVYSKSASRMLTAEPLWQNYLQQQGIDPDLEQTSASKVLATQQRSFAQACHLAHPPKLEVVWQNFEQAQLIPILPSAGNYLRALQELCRKDPEYREVIGDIQQIRLSLAANPKQHRITLKKGLLSVEMAAEMPNTLLIARLWFEENL